MVTHQLRNWTKMCLLNQTVCVTDNNNYNNKKTKTKQQCKTITFTLQDSVPVARENYTGTCK